MLVELLLLSQTLPILLRFRVGLWVLLVVWLSHAVPKASPIHTAPRPMIEHLTGKLATAAEALKSAEAEYDRIKALIVAEMLATNIKSQRTVWGLVSLTSRDKVTYSPAIKVLEINLKAEKDKEVATGAAKVTEGDPFIRVTWSK